VTARDDDLPIPADVIAARARVIAANAVLVEALRAVVDVVKRQQSSPLGLRIGRTRGDEQPR